MLLQCSLDFILETKNKCCAFYFNFLIYLKKMHDSFFPFNVVLEDFGGLHIELKINTLYLWKV